MNRIVTMKRHWLATQLAAVLMAAAPDMAWAQTLVQQGVRAGSNTTTVNSTSVSAGQVVSAGRGTTVTVATTDRTGESTPKVAKVTVTKKEDFLAEGITVASTGETPVTAITYGTPTTLTATLNPTFADYKNVTWSATSTDNGVVTFTSGATTAATVTTSATEGVSTVTVNGTHVGSVAITATALNADGEADDVVSTAYPLTINPKEVSNPTIELSSTSFIYNGSVQKPTVTSVKDGSTTIPSDEYDVSYSNANSTAAGTYTVYITSKSGSNYTINSSAQYTIIQKTNWTGTVTVERDGNTDAYRARFSSSEAGWTIKTWHYNKAVWYDCQYTKNPTDWTLQAVKWRVTLNGDATHNETVIEGTY